MTVTASFAPEPPVQAHRSDVVSARSRMRTKYGFQPQITALADSLTDAESLLLLAAAEASLGGAPVRAGLLALTDVRLLFLPRSDDAQALTVALASVHDVGWTSSGSTGTLSVLTDGAPAPTRFDAVRNADGRDLVAAVARLRPAAAPTAVPS